MINTFLPLPPIPEDCPPESKEFLIRTLTTLNKISVEKFLKGQKEHGGLITDRDCEYELNMEIIDLIFYFYGLKVKIDELHRTITKLNIELLEERKKNEKH